MSEMFRVFPEFQPQPPPEGTERSTGGNIAELLRLGLGNPLIRGINRSIGMSVPGQAMQRLPQPGKLDAMQALLGADMMRDLNQSFAPEPAPLQNAAQPPSMWEALGDITRTQGPELGPQQQSSYTQLQVPQLPDLQPTTPPDFSGALGAIGPPISAQQVPKGERQARVLGGMAAGGLSAVQNVSGRAAGLGEVLAGLAAGGSAERAAIGGETRQAEQIAQRQESQRQRTLANVETMKAASLAAHDQHSADTYNNRAMMEAQLQFQTERFNIEQERFIALPGGYIIPKTGEFVSTVGKFGDTMDMLDWTQKLMDEAGSQTVTGAGQEFIIKNIPENLQLSTAAAISASSNDEMVRLAAAMMERQNRETMAAQVLMLHEGSGAGMTKEQTMAAQAALVDTLSTMIFENWTAELNGQPVIYDTLNHNLWLDQASMNPQLKTSAGQRGLIAGALGSAR